MSKGIIETVGGATLLAGGIAATALTGGLTATAFVSISKTAMALITAGAGLLLSGVGTLLSKGPQKGFATTERNPTAPWNVIYGRSRVVPSMVYIVSQGGG